MEVSKACINHQSAVGSDPSGLPPEKIGKLFLEIKPEKLGKIEELGIDVFNSVPDEKLNTFKGVVKEAFADLKTDYARRSCHCRPSRSPINSARLRPRMSTRQS